MKLRNKIMIAIGLTFFCSLVVFYIVTRTIVLGSFKNLEEQNVRTNVNRVLNTLNDEFAAVRSTGGDWALCDDSRDFILNGGRKYIEDNLADVSLVNLNLNFMIFINASGKISHAKEIDLAAGTDRPVSRHLIDHITSHRFLLKHAFPEDSKAGFILLPEVTAIISSWPIAGSNRKGPFHGTLIVGRYFNEREIKKLSERTHLSISIVRANTASVPADFGKIRTLFSKKVSICVQELNNYEIAGYAEKRDIYGNPCITLRVDSPRDIYKHGKESVYYFMLVLSLVGILVLAVLLISIQLVVLSPLEKLKKHAVSIGMSGDLSKRLSAFRSDEIGELAKAFDNMMEQLMESHNTLKDEISERIRAEGEANRLQDQLLRAQKMEAIGTLAGGVAHDLNNILSAITSYPELLLMDLPQDSPLRKPLTTIKNSGERAAAIVQDLLTLARRGVSVQEVVNLNYIISEYFKSPEHKQIKTFHPKIQIETRLEKKLLNISGSPIHLSKTVMNLVSNAAEAILNEGKIIISTENRFVDKPTERYERIGVGDYVVLTVHDNGSGIAREDLDKIFEPFYTKKVMGRSGTGLGMAVVWGTIRDHNGYIDIQSNEETGTTITLYFPVTRKESKIEKQILSVKDYMGDKETILIVDDSEEQREIASAILKRLNYAVATVQSGEEAIDYLKNNSADLLLIDMIMEPGIDGLDTYKQILKLNPGQKAIIASGFSETDRVKEVQILGATKYLKKPYTIESVGIALKAELGK